MHPVSEDRKIFKYFTVMYAAALTTIAVLTISSQFLIQQRLDHSISDSHVLNLAARQRTYNVMLGSLAKSLKDGEDVENNRKEFTATLMQWQKAHQGLQNGSNFLDLPASDQDGLRQMFDQIETPYEQMRDAGNHIVTILYNDSVPFSPDAIKPYVNTLLSYENSYLLGMGLITFEYDRASKERIRKQKQIEYIITSMVLLVLLIEARVIFYPVAMRIKHIIRGLVASEERTAALAVQLQAANRQMEKSHNELREVNYALDKATYLVKTDHTGTIIYANDRYCHLTQYTMTELCGRPLFYNNTGKHESIIYDHLRDPARRNEVWQGEIFDHTKDNTGFWLDVTLMPVFDHTGKLYQYMAVCSDITRRKNHELEIRQLTEEKLLRQDMEQKIRSYAIISGQEKERKRVAAEIHDGIGQMMTSLRMKMEQIEDRALVKDAEISMVNNLLTGIIQETKRICSDLLPSVLDDFGLRSAIEELMNTCRHTTRNVDFLLEERLMPGILPKEVEIGTYRILQEALNNAIKHSGATGIEVHIDSSLHALHLLVRDNGKGFHFEESSTLSREFTKNNGIRNMKERAALLGGTLSINTQAGLGTIIQLEITF